MKYKVRVVTPPATGLAITRIMEVRRLDIKGINSLADAKRFVMDGVPAILEEKDSDRVINIIGGSNVIVDIYSTAEDIVEPTPTSNVGKEMGRFAKALTWYNNLSDEDRVDADYIVEVYAKLINNQEVIGEIEK